MARHSNRILRLALVAILGVFLLVLAYIIVTQSGVVPGDTGDTAAAATADEGISGGQLGLAAWPWALFLVIATVVLGAAIAYGQYSTSRASKAQLKAGDQASHELYREEDREGRR
jgi:hypothetical protein